MYQVKSKIISMLIVFIFIFNISSTVILATTDETKIEDNKTNEKDEDITTLENTEDIERADEILAGLPDEIQVPIKEIEFKNADTYIDEILKNYFGADVEYSYYRGQKHYYNEYSYNELLLKEAYDIHCIQVSFTYKEMIRSKSISISYSNTNEKNEADQNYINERIPDMFEEEIYYFTPKAENNALFWFFTALSELNEIKIDWKEYFKNEDYDWDSSDIIVESEWYPEYYIVQYPQYSSGNLKRLKIFKNDVLYAEKTVQVKFVPGTITGYQPKFLSQKISSNQYRLTLFDTDNNIIKSGKVKINNEEFEIKNGIVLLDKKSFLVGEEIEVEIELNKKYKLIHEIQKSSYGYLKIPKNEYELTRG